MVQHMLLLDIAPILGILGFTKVILRPVTRSVADLERRAGPLAHPAFAVALYVGVIWAWHIPAAYDLAVRHSDVHVLEHLSFLLAGSLYWWHLISPIRARMRLGGMGPDRLHGLDASCSSARSAWALAFAPAALYPYYEHHAARSGASRRCDDQAVAGLIMAVEQSLVMGDRDRRAVHPRARRVRARAAAPRALRDAGLSVAGAPRAVLTGAVGALARELDAQALEQAAAPRACARRRA